MLIVSQDKRTVAPFGEAQTVAFVNFGYNNKYSVNISDSDPHSYSYEFGIYETEIRTKGVLRELTDAYQNGARVFCMPEK